MASSPSAPIIPVTTTIAATATATPQSTAIRQSIARVADSTRKSLSNLRPWSELLDRSAFSRPDTLSEAWSRLRSNLAYFRVNYLTAVAASLALSLLTHPSSLLLLLALLAAWALLYLFRPSDPPLVLLGRHLSDRETLLALVLLSFLVVFLTSVGSIIMSAITVASAAVAAHGAFRVPDDLFLDDQELVGPAAGFLSFLGGSAPNAAYGPAVVAARI